MVTCGPKGCLLQNAGAAVLVGAPRVLPVDTTGAGDIFGGKRRQRPAAAGRAPEALSRGRADRHAASPPRPPACPRSTPAASPPSSRRRPCCGAWRAEQKQARILWHNAFRSALSAALRRERYAVSLHMPRYMKFPRAVHPAPGNCFMLRYFCPYGRRSGR